MSIESSCKQDGCYIVSEGTLRYQDLVPRYLDALRELSPEAYQQVVAPAVGFSIYPSYASEDNSHEWWDSESCHDLVGMLWDALEDNAPEGFSFGASEGDGACIGFWQASDD